MWMRIADALAYVPGASIGTRASVVDSHDDGVADSDTVVDGRLGRYTRFGWRIGFEDGPWRVADASQCPQALVRNPTEWSILQRILAECDGTGAGAHRLACQLTREGVHHPRLNRPWRAGSIIMIYGTHQRRAESRLMDIIAAASVQA